MKAINDDFNPEGRDEERALYPMGVELRRALAEPPEVDAAGEWKRVMESVRAPRRRVLRLSVRRIAVAASVIAVVGTVAATVVFGDMKSVFRIASPEEAPAVEEVNPAAMVVYSPDDSVALAKPFLLSQGKVYEDVALEEILRDVATLYDVEVECAPDKAPIRFYLSIPPQSSLEEVAVVLNSFEQLQAEIVTANDNTKKLTVR